MISKYIVHIYILVTFLFVSACSTLENQNVEDSTNHPKLGRTTKDPYRLIAIDLVGALLQAKSMDPTEMSVQLPFSGSRLSLAIEDVLVESGVTIQRVKRKYGENVLAHTISLTAKDKYKNAYVVTMILDRIGLKREYILAEDYIEPISSLYIRGAPLSNIELQDEIFLK